MYSDAVNPTGLLASPRTPGSAGHCTPEATRQAGTSQCLQPLLESGKPANGKGPHILTMAQQEDKDSQVDWGQVHLSNRVPDAVCIRRSKGHHHMECVDMSGTCLTILSLPKCASSNGRKAMPGVVVTAPKGCFAILY